MNFTTCEFNCSTIASQSVCDVGPSPYSVTIPERIAPCHEAKELLEIMARYVKDIVVQ